MYPSACMGNAVSSDTRQASSSIADINPSFKSFCRWLSVAMEGVQSCSTLTQGGRKGSTFKILVFLPISTFSLSPFSVPLSSLFGHKEGGKERMVDGTQGYLGVQGQPPALNLVASVVKRLGPLKCGKGPGKLSLPTSPTPHTSHQLHQQGIQKPYPQRASQWLGGLLTAQGLKAKPAR
jgi:hypothetical protein